MKYFDCRTYFRTMSNMLMSAEYVMVSDYFKRVNITQTLLNRILGVVSYTLRANKYYERLILSCAYRILYKDNNIAVY